MTSMANLNPQNSQSPSVRLRHLANFRSIACVNFIYRLLTKIIAERISKVMSCFSSSKADFNLADEMAYDFGRKKICRDVV